MTYVLEFRCDPTQVALVMDIAHRNEECRPIPIAVGGVVTMQVPSASAIQVNIMCNSAGVFDAEHFQRIAESTCSKLLKL